MSSPTWEEGDLLKGDIISLFSEMGDKGEGGVKNLKKWVTSFMDGPKDKNEASPTTTKTEAASFFFSNFH